MNNILTRFYHFPPLCRFVGDEFDEEPEEQYDGEEEDEAIDTDHPSLEGTILRQFNAYTRPHK
jgi:hypothetical protein